MKNTREGNGTARLLLVLAWVQAALIATLVVLLLRRGDEEVSVPTIQVGHSPADAPPTPTEASSVRAATQQPEAVGGGVAGVVEVPPLPADAPVGGVPAASPLVPAALPAVVPATLEGTVLYGRVVNEVGEAITEGVVWFTRPGASKQVATLSLRPGHSDFAIAGLSPGPLDFHTRVTGHKELRETIEIPPGVPRLRRDIVLLSSWLLTVKIQTPEGQPLHLAMQEAGKGRRMLRHVQVSAVVTASPAESDFPPTPYREVEIGLGRWRSATGVEAMVRDGPKLAKDIAGVLEIDTKQPVWVSAVLRHRVLAAAQVQPGQSEVTLTVALEQVLKDLCTIRGRVVDAVTGTPVANAAVGFGDLQSSGSAGKSDDQGMFEVKDLRSGLLDVEISGDKRSARRDLILLQPGQTLDLGDVPVFEFRSIKGRCEGLQGKAEDGRIAYTPLEPTPHPAMRRHTDSASVAADGTFTLYLPDGRYLLRASGAGGVVTEIDTRTLGDEPLVLKLAKEVGLRLDVQTNGEPWELAVFDSVGRELFRRALRDGWKFPLWFLPGDYRAELTDRHGKKQTRQIKLGPDGADFRVP